MPARIKLLTYNIHKGFNITNRKFVLHQIREVLRAANTDLAFLQEIQGEHTVKRTQVDNWPEMSQYEFLADQLWPHYAYGKNAIYDSGHHGNAILSKFPFVEWENLNVSLLKRASRSLLHGIIVVPEVNIPLHMICVHLDQIRFMRNRQLKKLVSHISERIPADAPLIVAGDFNDWGEHVQDYLYAGSGLREVHHHRYGYHAVTYPARWPMFPLDRIYYRNLEPVDCHCLESHSWNALSDHAPLYAEFELQ
jgi:endonuclease/exonuclease/phosphatase family metal-dependent hydrolase